MKGSDETGFPLTVISDSFFCGRFARGLKPQSRRLLWQKAPAFSAHGPSRRGTSMKATTQPKTEKLL
jgi:hypothetical protein